jgi:acetyl-CoA acetyltransferase
VTSYSQQRVTEATANGFLKQEIIPITIQGKKGQQIIPQDEGIRPETSL